MINPLEKMLVLLQCCYDLFLRLLGYIGLCTPPSAPATAASTGGRHRRLGGQEQMYYECHNMDQYNIGMVVFLSSDHAITRAHLQRVMTRLMTRHPLLRMRVTRCDGELYWQQMDDVTPDVRVQETNDWKGVFEDTIHERYNTNAGPLWRVTLLPDVTSDYMDPDFEHHAVLILGFSHVITDGQGTYSAHVHV